MKGKYKNVQVKAVGQIAKPPFNATLQGAFDPSYKMTLNFIM